MHGRSKELDKEFRKALMSMYVFLYVATYLFYGLAQFQLVGTFPNIISYTQEILYDTDEAFAQRLNEWSSHFHVDERVDEIKQKTAEFERK